MSVAVLSIDRIKPSHTAILTLEGYNFASLGIVETSDQESNKPNLPEDISEIQVFDFKVLYDLYKTSAS